MLLVACCSLKTSLTSNQKPATALNKKEFFRVSCVVHRESTLPITDY